jgi:peptide deformylase
MTDNEKQLIQSADGETPFRVLLITNKADSIILRTKAPDVNLSKDNEVIQHLIARMKATMKVESGVGIAAPQIGISRNIYLFTRIDKPDAPVEVAINPKIVSFPNENICFERDGCLSIPDVSANSVRYAWVEVEYSNEKGEKMREKLSGYSREDDFTVIIFQHEFDHLRGILFTDKICQ